MHKKQRMCVYSIYVKIMCAYNKICTSNRMHNMFSYILFYKFLWLCARRIASHFLLYKTIIFFLCNQYLLKYSIFHLLKRVSAIDFIKSYIFVHYVYFFCKGIIHKIREPNNIIKNNCKLKT